MKYISIFILILFFIGPVADKDKSVSNVIRDGVYNYITCLDNYVDYSVQNIPLLSKLTNISYDKTYDKVMKNRILQNHLVASGETLDDIIRYYNNDINNIENFRKVIFKENPNVVSYDYQIKSGEYLLVPSENLISKK